MADNVLDLKVIRNEKKIKEEKELKKFQKMDATRISKSLKLAIKEVPTSLDGFCLIYFRHNGPGVEPTYGLLSDFRHFHDIITFPNFFHHVWIEAHASTGD